MGPSAKVNMVYHALRERIERGEVSSSGRLDGESALAAEFEVSRHTIREALERLVRNDLVERRKGSGTYVQNRTPHREITLSLDEVSSQELEISRHSELKLIDLRSEVPGPHIAETLKLGPKERVRSITRLRLHSGQVYSHIVSHVPERIASLFPEKGLYTEHMHKLIAQAGVVSGWSTQFISAAPAGPVIAERLEVEVGAALLTLKRATFDTEGQGIRYMEVHYRPDLFCFQMDLARG